VNGLYYREESSGITLNYVSRFVSKRLHLIIIDLDIVYCIHNAMRFVMTKPTHVYMDTIVKVILFLVMAFHYVSVYETS